jgi:alpha-L-fucosidase
MRSTRNRLPIKAMPAYAKLNKNRDMAKYRQYMRNQITELLTNYGKIDILWLDFSFPRGDGHGKGKDEWGSVELLKTDQETTAGHYCR